MTVRIGHASIDENGRASGGATGDQTGKELCTRDWYSKGWNVLLRPKSATLAELSARACEAACANPNIGYDQGGRNTLYAKAKAVGFDMAQITSGCECDCSSLMHVCAIAGGAKLTYDGNGYTTRTMAAAFKSSGDYEKLTASKYLTTDANLMRGDILVKEGSHTVMVLSNGSAVAPDPNVVITYPLESDAAIYYSVRLPLLQKGMKRDAVKAMQNLLWARGYDLPRTGDFDEVTALALLSFQRNMGLKADALCGPEVWSALLGLTGMG